MAPTSTHPKTDFKATGIPRAPRLIPGRRTAAYASVLSTQSILDGMLKCGSASWSSAKCGHSLIAISDLGISAVSFFKTKAQKLKQNSEFLLDFRETDTRYFAIAVVEPPTPETTILVAHLRKESA